MPDRQWWVELPDGTRLSFAAGGILIGRRADSDVVLEDPNTSRRHALVYLDANGPTVVPLGSAPTRVGETVADGPTSLADGDELGVGEMKLKVGSTTVDHPESSGVWLLQRGGGGLFGVKHDRFMVGGSPEDDVHIPGLAAGALRFHAGPQRLAVEATVEGVTIEPRGTVLTPGDVVSLAVDDEIVLETERIVVRGGETVSTAATRGPYGGPAGLPFEVSLEFLARGGRLRVRTDIEETMVYLAGRRCDLAAALLKPPEGHIPGDFVSDEAIASRVWPGQDKGRTDINTLIHRLRKDLLRAGLDGLALIERSEGGGATRFAMATGATARVI